jgi:sensor domain CHASE-containing protein
MDPLAAIGLASAIVQFVDYSTTIIHGAKEIYDSATGSTKENQSLEDVVIEMQHLSQKLDYPQNAQQTDDEVALSRLAAECKILSDQILGLLTNIKPKNVKSKRQVLWAALKNKWNERDKQELEKRLENCRSQLELQLNFLMR